MIYKISSPAKINLGLKVLNKRADGFHNIETTFQFLNWGDDITIETKVNKNQIVCPSVEEKENIVSKLINLLKNTHGFKENLKVTINKRIPLKSGLGGGSSNAASVLVAINKIFNLDLSKKKLIDLALVLGSDVPIFVHGRSSIATGRGEIFKKVSLVENPVLVIIPNSKVSTKLAFENFNNIESIKYSNKKNFNSFGTAFSRIGRSFTYPNVDQRVGQFAFNQSHDFKLRSQVSNDIELGHKFGFNKLKMSNTFYYMNLRAELYYDAVNFMNKNLDASKRYGFESLTTYNINKRIYVKNSFSTSKSKMRAGFYKGKEIPGVPDLTNTFEVNFKIRDEINFYTNLYYKGSTRMINDTKNFQVKIPEYYLLNMGVKGSFNQFKYSLAANNVLDKSYYNYAVASASTYNAYNTYPLSEFNMLLKVSMEF